jgi:hypothetical protein
MSLLIYNVQTVSNKGLSYYLKVEYQPDTWGEKSKRLSENF